MSTTHILVKGRVQGVGFRFYAMRLAESLALTGFVKNLPAGGVEIEVEGETDTINSFITKLQKGDLGRNIADIDVEWIPYQKKYESFDVRF
ncbi:MAG: acylphosphatase [bacterium]